MDIDFLPIHIEVIIKDSNFPANKNHGELSYFLSKNLPAKAKTIKGIAIVYPSWPASDNACQNPEFFFIPRTVAAGAKHFKIFEPKYDLREGLEDTFLWFLEQKIVGSKK